MGDPKQVSGPCLVLHHGDINRGRTILKSALLVGNAFRQRLLIGQRIFDFAKCTQCNGLCLLRCRYLDLGAQRSALVYRN